MPSTSAKSARLFLTRGAAGVIALTCALGAVGAVHVAAAPAPPPIDAEHLEIMAEQYNLARLKVERATAALEATDRRIAAAQLRVRLVQNRTRARAASLYLGAGAATSLPIGDADHVADVRRRSRYLDAAEAPDRDLLASLQREMQTLATERASQRAARDLLQHNADAAAQMKRRLDALAAEAAAAARAELAATASRTPAPVGVTTGATGAIGAGGAAKPNAPRNEPAPAPGPRPGPPSPPPTTTPQPAPSPTPTGAEPPVSPGAGAAVAFARAQLGKPYAFATAGPNTFDCSGLTMAAWASVGVRMPHYSGSQAAMFPRVTFAQLKPGDILVFYTDLHHVGLYIGGGMMIHAPQTGDVVKIAPAWRDTFQWGVRPR